MLFAAQLWRKNDELFQLQMQTQLRESDDTQVAALQNNKNNRKTYNIMCKITNAYKLDTMNMLF